MYPFKPQQDDNEQKANLEQGEDKFATKAPRSILTFRSANPEEDRFGPRWQIGIDKQQVALYVGIALIAGFGLGYLTLRFMKSAEEQKASLQNRNEPVASRNKPRETEPSLPPTLRHVSRVLKADTIEVEGIGNVRLIGVEVPQSKTPNDIYATLERNALAFTEKSLSGQDVRLDFDPTFAAKDNKDSSGNTLAYVFTKDGQFLNAELLKQGYAFVRPAENHKLEEDFRSYEKEAMTTMRGLWGDTSSAANTPPSSTNPNTPPTASATDPTKRPKLSPLSPNDIGPNIPGAVPNMAVPPSSTTPAAPSEMMVIATGDKIYHKKGCELAVGKKTVMGISQARSSGYTACSRCFPSTSIRMQ